MYVNRIEAGLVLANELMQYRGTDAVILAVPRGGVPVAYAVAKELQLPMDIVLIKKLGHPQHKEYAIGAVSLSDRILVPHEDVSNAYIEKETGQIRKRLRQMYERFKGDQPSINITGKTVIIIDDGIATGRTLISAIRLIRKSNPLAIVIAAPVASTHAVQLLKEQADQVVCPMIADRFAGIGSFYEDFTQTTDREVVDYLDKAKNLSS